MEDDSPPASLSAFINRKDPSNWSAQVVNLTEPKQIEEMVTDLFDGLGMETTAADLRGLDDDVVVIVNDGRIVAASPIDTLKETLLLVNSDLYKTGSREIDDVTIPEVILKLSDTVFTVEGYPASNTEKLVLTLVARYIEQQATVDGTGTLRTSFQRLSRLDDEQGTREVYERLGQLEDLETHVYGIPDWTPPAEFNLHVHEVRDDEILYHWFVVFRSEADRDVAMVASMTGTNAWKGYWTFDPEEIRAIDQYISRTF